MTNRYQTNGTKGEFEPGSDEQVLRNLVGITSTDDMDELELRLLGELYDEVLLQNLPDRALTVADLKHWHHRWLGNVYVWAGQERSVNLSKDGFPFASAALLTGLLVDFERNCLKPWTPCGSLAHDELVSAIAVTHVELILIHPFREGNGRLSRLLARRDGRAGRPRAAGLQQLGTAQGGLHSRRSRRTFGRLQPHVPVCGRGHSRWRCQPQRASLMWGKRTVGCCNLCSSCTTLRPVSTAVELATARSTAWRLGVLRWRSGVLGMLCPLGRDSGFFYRT
jgi:cell filamentation protein